MVKRIIWTETAKVDNFRQMAYRVHGTTLFISDFWDTRRNPNKRRF